jgi:DNA-directed RNA polymerase subunit RPC12/RpoP
MVEYKCEKCGKIFDHKGTYEKHINRKNPCNEQVLKGESLKCELCGKDFLSKGALHYHKSNNVCKGPVINNIDIDNVEKLNSVQNNIVEGDFKVDGDVKVVKFGDENLSYISDDTFKKIIGRGFKSLEEFMNHVHFNKDHPENHNIYVASLKDGHVVTYNGERWDVGLADQVLDDIIQQKSDILEDKYDEIVDKLSPMESKKFNNFMNRKDDAKVNLKLKRELRVQLYNNRHFAKGAKKLMEEKEKLIQKSLSDEHKNNNEIKQALELMKNKSLEDLDVEQAKSILKFFNNL